ncbi:MAG: ABC transporter ATP-binding protein [Desulfobacterota bacterium]|nr:ABC transporter ATP-binding protein [Thermodesulfobacteriota bacterium]MDW8001678.1 ABC transporter ATP-binding protein [Deltaproteobacteria bacterium]
MKVVEVRDLVKNYNSLRAVDRVSFDIFKGECFGFLGPNGAGKTTIIRILYGLSPPTSGEVRIFGMDIKTDAPLIKAKIGVVPQEENLDVELSVMENLIVYARFFDIPGKKAKAIAERLLEFANLKEKKAENVRSLSGGMKRSLLLARALINDPELIILDEPTVGLDPKMRRMIWERLIELKSNGKTLILTTHYMEEAQRLCDRVAIMDQGKIVELGNTQEIIKRYGGDLEKVYLRLTGKSLGA